MRALHLAQRGLAAVELAVMMPVFLLLMLGTAELGRACYQYNALIKAAHDGARYMSAHARNGAGVIVIEGDDLTVAQNLVVSGTPAAGGTARLPSLAANHVTITPSPEGYVTVQVAYPYVPILAVIPTFGHGGDGIAPVATLTATSVMAVL